MNRDRRVRKVGDGWGFVIDTRRPDGSRRQIRRQGFATARLANEEIQRLLGDAQRGSVSSIRGGATVAAFLLDTWLPSLPGKIRPTTVYSYEKITRNHLVPLIGSRKLAAVTGADVEAMLGTLARQGLSPKTQRNILGVLSAAMTAARRWKILAFNPCQDVRKPDWSRQPARVWTAADLGVFLTATRNNRLAAVWRLATVTGARRGELAGLLWTDLDLEAGTVTIRQQRTTAGGRVIEGPTKTRSGARTVSIDDETVSMLTRWRAEQRKEFVRLGVRPERLYVVTNQSGGPLDPDELTKEFKRITVSLGLPPLTFHGLRHSSATWLVRTGTSPRTVQQRLGHSTVGTTLSIYAHVLPGDDRAAAEAFASAIPSAPHENVT